MMITEQQIHAALAGYQDPVLHQELPLSKAIRKLEIHGTRLKLSVVLSYPAAGLKNQIIKEIKDRLSGFTNLTDIDIQLSWEILAHAVQPGVKSLPGVKNIIAIASGKGGVGKSTVAANLALALAAEGAQVGVLDADIYGPSQPLMLGTQGQAPETKDRKSLEPVMSYGIQAMSIGYLIEANTAMVWRGPMVSSALQQLLYDTNWRELDYLIVDLPPGTGDIQLTLSQKIPVSGAVVVTTPQEIALLDARKAIVMFGKVKIPVLGIVENMSYHSCSHCGHQDAIFGHGGGEQLAAEFNTQLLGSLPLDSRIREHADSGKPTVVAEPDSPIALKYRNIARTVAAKLALQAKAQISKFPRIVVE